MGRTPCCGKSVNKGAWSSEEDEKLANYISTHGEGKWRMVAENAGLNRCAKSCRLRWLNYLKPGIKRGNITSDEEDLIIRLHTLLGNRWALIAGRLPGRTDNEIKNYWKTILVKKLEDQALRSQYTKQGVPPQNDQIYKVQEVRKDNFQVKNNTSTHLDGFEFSKFRDDQVEKVIAINDIKEPSNNGDHEIELTCKQMQEKDACDHVENFLMTKVVDKGVSTIDAMESYLAQMENENDNNNQGNGDNFISVGNEANCNHEDYLYVELQKLASFLDLEDQRGEFDHS